MKKEIKKDGKNAVIYARYSSSGQREESIEGQIRDCQRYAEANDLLIIDTYIDRAITGTTDNRENFQRMIADSAKHNFQYVICWKLDRFSRDRYDNAVYKRKLKQNGVKVLYAMENIPDDPSGIILESVMEGLAEYYTRDLAEKVKRGNYDSALQGKSLGHPMFGYTIGDDHKYHIDPATAPAVRYIFEQYAAGVPNREIVKEVNARGYRSIHGAEFNDNAIPRIIKNEKYMGIYRYYDLVIEDAVPPIVDKELFSKANERMIKTKRAPAAKRTVNYMLTGKLFCGLCGSAMVGDSGTSRTKGTIHRYYTCRNVKFGHTCHKKSIKKDEIENIVIDELIHFLGNDELLERIADGVIKCQSENMKNTQIPSMQKSLKDLERREANLMRAIEEGAGAFAEFRDRIQQLRAEENDLKISLAREQASNFVLTREQVLYFFVRLRTGDPADEGYRQTLIDTLVRKIFVFDDKITIVLNYTDENAAKELTIENLDCLPGVRVSDRQAGQTIRIRTYYIFDFLYWSLNLAK